jgi:hypothetical protein
LVWVGSLLQEVVPVEHFVLALRVERWVWSVGCARRYCRRRPRSPICPRSSRRYQAHSKVHFLATTGNSRDFSRAEALVKLLDKEFELDEGTIVDFANAKKFDEVAACIGLLGGAPTELTSRALEGARCDLVLVPCKSAQLRWATVESILRNRPSKQKIDERTLGVAGRDYGKLTLATAQRTLRFWQVHNRLEK